MSGSGAPPPSDAFRIDAGDRWRRPAARDSSPPPGPGRGSLRVAAEALLFFLIAFALVWPLFRTDYLVSWGSDDGYRIADARLLAENWPDPKWQPEWHNGIRYAYVYPPLIRYLTAAGARVTGRSIARVYHAWIALLLALAIPGVYLLARALTGSAAAAWVAAAGQLLVSPVYLLMPHWRADAPFLAPQRVNAAVRYGDGPHLAALGLAAFCLAAAWRAGETGARRWIALSAFAGALALAADFYILWPLALLLALAMWSLHVTRGRPGVWAAAAAIGALAWALSAFWMVPSYLRNTVGRFQFVGPEGNPWSVWIGIAAAIVFLHISDRLARGRAAAAPLVFASGAAAYFSLDLLGHHYLGLWMTATPWRLGPELDLALTLLAAALLARAPRAATVIAAAALLAISSRYAANAWKVLGGDPAPEQRIERQLARWSAANAPASRAYLWGTARIWYGAWIPLRQATGGAEPGLLGFALTAAEYQIARGASPELASLWLAALGVDLLLVHPSAFDHLERFAAYPAAWDAGDAGKLLRVPRRWESPARVVRRSAIDSALPVRQGDDAERLRAYVEAIENGPDAPAAVERPAPSRIRVRARIGEGESLLVQETYDSAWRATAGGRPLPVRPDAMGFLIVDAPPGGAIVELTFHTPAAYWAGRALSLGALLLGAVMLRRRRP